MYWEELPVLIFDHRFLGVACAWLGLFFYHINSPNPQYSPNAI
jgi:hypothetical protein